VVATSAAVTSAAVVTAAVIADVPGRREPWRGRCTVGVKEDVMRIENILKIAIPAIVFSGATRHSRGSWSR